MSVTYYQNPDGTLSFVESEEFIEITGGVVDGSSVEIDETEYAGALVALEVTVEESTADLVAEAATEQAAADAARATVLAALATASGLTVEEIEAALG